MHGSLVDDVKMHTVWGEGSYHASATIGNTWAKKLSLEHVSIQAIVL